jgi:hypothetical protein
MRGQVGPQQQNDVAAGPGMAIPVMMSDNIEASVFYRNAAGSKTPVGKEAMASLIRLDLQDNPQNYLPVRLGLDSEKYLVAQVDNSTTESVTEVIVAIEFVDASGRRQQAQYKVSGQIGPGKRAMVNTGIGPDPKSLMLRQESLRQV